VQTIWSENFKIDNIFG